MWKPYKITLSCLKNAVEETFAKLNVRSNQANLELEINGLPYFSLGVSFLRIDALYNI